MSAIRRVYVEKKPQFRANCEELRREINGFLNIPGIETVRIFIRYDAENVPDAVFSEALNGVFAEPPLDLYYEETLPPEEAGTVTFGVEALPGQYDQRADSAEQALRLIDMHCEPIVRCAVIYRIGGVFSEEELSAIRNHLCNPVDSRWFDDFEKPDTLRMQYEMPEDVPVLSGFSSEEDAAFGARYASLNLAMTYDDFCWIRAYFRDSEHRDPTLTEIRVLDTYWSDHCRHTTFSTHIRDIRIEDGAYAGMMREALKAYEAARDELYATEERKREKPVCLMDLATIGMKKLKADGVLSDMEESGENNACTVIVPVETEDENGKHTEEWLLFFKNETHNHPTEIEPFGGAATCLGGAIRDPLSGRGYVYHAMRVSGAADPTRGIAETPAGKLPQKKLVRDAARGYSSYGNQIGLATGLVDEIYHPGYVAKHMEIGAVMGAAKRSNVKRIEPVSGDVVLLVGGRTGRDGIGGATGSSKAHSVSSLETCGAEVQKGNAPTERKIQRLFRRPEVSTLIKKCNDFGAGGVSVAIGELAEGLDIDLDAVPKKYEGLDGTELAISESQERMAVVLAPSDEEAFLRYAAEENLEAVRVARVTDSGRLVMRWRGKTIVDLSRAFLDTNGASQETDVRIVSPQGEAPFSGVVIDRVKEALAQGDERNALLCALNDLNVCSRRGLQEQFDASIGRGTVLMPFGGLQQMTPVQTMVAKLPVENGETDTVSAMSYGFDPYLSAWSPFHGASYAVTASVARIVAAGIPVHNLHFTFQEYFGKMNDDPARWGMPFAALLGAFCAQLGFRGAAIGGKDSMSGTFNDLDVPPTLVSFAVGCGRASETVTPELKRAGNRLALFEIERDAYGLPVYPAVVRLYEEIGKRMAAGVIVSGYAVDAYGAACALMKMAFGNELGVTIDGDVAAERLFAFGTGNLVAEIDGSLSDTEDAFLNAALIGTVSTERCFVHGNTIVLLPEAQQCFTSRLEKVYPTTVSDNRDAVEIPEGTPSALYVCKHRVARPHVFIPVFPGTNCEYDLTKAFTEAGATVSCGVFRNLSADDISQSVALYEKEIDRAQIVMFPGGFSAGDEPDGSAKFFAVAFRSGKIRDALMRLLHERDGLALGICNGFQAMIKLGLLPDGAVSGQTAASPTLTFNTISRHISRMAYLKVMPNNSPWLSLAKEGDVYVSPVSHGEGRFVGDAETVRALFRQGQVGTVYCDPYGRVSMDDTWNLNGSVMAVEGILSSDGRCYGKMAHEERKGKGLMRNIYGKQDMRLFEAGVQYFR